MKTNTCTLQMKIIYHKQAYKNIQWQWNLQNLYNTNRNYRIQIENYGIKIKIHTMKNGKDQILQRLTCLKTSYFQIKSFPFFIRNISFWNGQF